jgi:hypothetical protein
MTSGSHDWRALCGNPGFRTNLPTFTATSIVATTKGSQPVWDDTSRTDWMYGVMSEVALRPDPPGGVGATRSGVGPRPEGRW